MRKIEFKLKEKSKANQLFLYVMYEGGDADTEHPEEFILHPDLNANNYEDHLDIIETIVDEYKLLKIS